MSFHVRTGALCVCVCLFTTTAAAHEDEARDLPDAGTPSHFETTITARRPFTAASAGNVRNEDFALRPMRDPSDLLEVTPGLISLQHAGGGKATQYFLRGFDADHGTDVRLTVDQVPVNMVSHAHGQGYADLHFVIPELIEKLEVDKGSYSADLGDFATAGAVNLVTRRHFDKSSATLQAGSFNTYRGLVIAAPEIDEKVQAYIAGEAATGNGPFILRERLQRLNLVARASYFATPRTELSLQLQSYAASWRASGQLPLRAVESGQLPRFGFVDPSDGGDSHRHSVLAMLHHHGERNDSIELRGYALQYRLAMLSNFTIFANDAVNGDQIEQNDDRTVTGFDARYRRPWEAAGRSIVSSFGAQLRNDRIDTALWNTTLRRRLRNVVNAEIAQTSLGLWTEHDTQWFAWLRTVVGARMDSYDFHVEDRNETFDPTLPSTSGSKTALLVSPKASVVLSPLQRADVFVNFGRGFHSNDARGIVSGSSPSTPLTPATTYEVGVRSRPLNGLDVAVSAWGIDLDSETVWVGDEGTTEARGASRRRGLEFEARYRINRWLRADADVTYTRARFVSGEAIPLAPVWTGSGGLSAVHPSGFFGSLRSMGFSDRPANEDRSLTATGTLLLDAEAGYENDRFRVALSMKNMLNTQWREAQFANESRLSTESAPVEDLHFTPGYPRAVALTTSVFF